MVITIEIIDFVVMKTLIDQGNSIDILYWRTFQCLGFSKDILKRKTTNRERVYVRGYVDLKTRFVGRTNSKTTKSHDLVVDVNISYNVLLERPSLNALGAIMSTPHLAMKFLSEDGDMIIVYRD